MKRILLFTLLLLGFSASAQKTTIKPDYVVGSTKFYIDGTKDGKNMDQHKANVIYDYFVKDTTSVFIGKDGGYTFQGMFIKFTKDKIFPVYFYLDDGEFLERTTFDSYELTVSSANPKIGERLRGKFDGVVTITRKDSTVVKHHLKGKFTHIMEDTPAKRRWKRQIEQENLSKKIYLQTGFYDIMNPYDGMEIKAPTYSHIHTGDEYYLYNTNQRSYELLQLTTKAIVQPDDKNPKIFNIKLLFDNSSMSYFKGRAGQVLSTADALIVDDVLYMADNPITIANDGLIVPIASKSKKEADMIAEKLNLAIQKFEKAQNRQNAIL